MIYNSILETIGNTPVVRLNRMGPDHVDMYVKVESFNPLASVKDRLAWAIVNDAEAKFGLIKNCIQVDERIHVVYLLFSVTGELFFKQYRICMRIRRTACAQEF